MNGNDISRNQLIDGIIALKRTAFHQSGKTTLDPYRGSDISREDQVKFLLEQLRTYLGQDIGSLKRAAERRAYLFGTISSILFLGGLFGGLAIVVAGIVYEKVMLSIVAAVIFNRLIQLFVGWAYLILENANKLRSELTRWGLAFHHQRQFRVQHQQMFRRAA